MLQFRLKINNQIFDVGRTTHSPVYIDVGGYYRRPFVSGTMVNYHNIKNRYFTCYSLNIYKTFGVVETFVRGNIAVILWK